MVKEKKNEILKVTSFFLSLQTSNGLRQIETTASGAYTAIYIIYMFSFHDS
jgi:hypothetical protein